MNTEAISVIPYPAMVVGLLVTHDQGTEEALTQVSHAPFQTNDEAVTVPAIVALEFPVMFPAVQIPFPSAVYVTQFIMRRS